MLARTQPARRRVLYIEDDHANRVLMRELLKHFSGVALLTASLGNEGIKLARAEHPDAILLDLHLPDMSGEDVLLELRADTATSDAPVIVVSADTAAARIRAITKAGASAYITKPIDARALFAALHAALEPRLP